MVCISFPSSTFLTLVPNSLSLAQSTAVAQAPLNFQTTLACFRLTAFVLTAFRHTAETQSVPFFFLSSPSHPHQELVVAGDQRRNKVGGGLAPCLFHLSLRVAPCTETQLQLHDRGLV